MDEQVKHRLVGAAVLVTVAVVVVPMILGRSDDAPAPPASDAGASTPSVAPPRDGAETDVRVVPLDAPAPEPEQAQARDTQARGSGGEPQDVATARARDESGSSSTAPAGGEARFAVQLGSFAEEKNATALRDRLISEGYRAYVEPATGGSAPVTRVLVGPQRNREEAERMLRRLRGETKLEGLVVRYRG